MLTLNNSSFQSFNTEEATPNYTLLVFFSVLAGCAFLVSITVNLISLVLFIKNRELLANPANKLICNFIVTSLALSVLVVPASCVTFAMKRSFFGEFICHIYGISSICLPAVELLTLASMAYDRHHFICKPLTYPVNMTAFKINVIIFFIWFTAIVSSLMPVFGWGSYGFNKKAVTCTVLWTKSFGFGLYYCFIAFLFPFAVQTYCYAGIIKAAKRQAKFGRRMSRVAIMPLQVARIIRETSASKTVRKTVIVMAVFIITWMPFMVIIVLEGLQTNAQITIPLFIFNAFTYASSILYPLLFVFRARNLKTELRTLLRSSRWFDCMNSVSPGDDTEPSERKERRRSSLSLDGYDLGSRRRSSRMSRVSWSMPVVIEDGIEPSKEPRSSVTASTVNTDVSSMHSGGLLPGELDYSNTISDKHQCISSRVIKT